MNRRAIVLLSFAGVLAVVYVWFFLLPDRGELKMAIVERPGRPLTFAFNRAQEFHELKLAKVETPVGGEPYEQVIWHLVRNEDEDANDNNNDRDDNRATKHVTYGRRVRGMRSVEGLRPRGEPLQQGVTYRFSAITNEGKVFKEFQSVYGRPRGAQ